MKRILILVLFWSGAAAAQAILTYEEAVSQTLATHPLLEAGTQRIAISEGYRLQAGLSPNPTFTLQQESIRFSSPPPVNHWTDTDTFAVLRHTFETSGKRKRRIGVASVDIRRAELERELLSREITGRVKTAYWAAAGAQQIHTLLTETVKNFDLTVDYHEIRVREGAMAEADLLRIRLESERLNLASQAAFLEAERARIALFREMGRSEIPASVRLDALEEPSGEPLSADQQLALKQRTEMKLARLAVELGEADLGLQQAEQSPDIHGIFGYKRAAGLNTLLAGVEVDLPIRNRNQGNIAAVTASISATRAELASVSASIQAEVNAAYKGYEIRRRQILETLRPMLDQAAESARIAQASYREGGWDLLRLLDAEQLRIETESLYYQALAEYHQSIASLETAMGVEP